MSERDALQVDGLTMDELGVLLDVLYGQARDARYPVNEALRAPLAAHLRTHPDLCERLRRDWLASRQSRLATTDVDVAVAGGWYDLELTGPW